MGCPPTLQPAQDPRAPVDGQRLAARRSESRFERRNELGRLVSTISSVDSLRRDGSRGAAPTLRVALLGPASNPVFAAARAVLTAIDAIDVALETEQRISARVLQDARIDLLIVAGYHHFLGPNTRAAVKKASVGLHPALLPTYRGSYPLWWALRNGEREAGLTLYVLDDGIDTGRIISQARVAIGPGETFASLYRKVAAKVPELLVPLVRALLEGTGIPADEQDEEQASVYTTPGRLIRIWMKARWMLRSIGRR